MRRPPVLLILLSLLVLLPSAAGATELLKIDERSVPTQRYLDLRLDHWRQLQGLPNDERSREAGERAIAELLRQTLLLAHADHLGLHPTSSELERALETWDRPESQESVWLDHQALSRFLDGATVRLFVPRELRRRGTTSETICRRVSPDTALANRLGERFAAQPPPSPEPRLVTPDEPFFTSPEEDDKTVTAGPEAAVPQAVAESPEDTLTPASRLLAVRFDADGQLVRILTDGHPRFRSFRLLDPARFVLDLEGLTTDLWESQIEIGNGVVRRVRVGQFQDPPDAIARVVFDLDEAECDCRVERSGAELRVYFGPGAS